MPTPALGDDVLRDVARRVVEAGSVTAAGEALYTETGLAPATFESRAKVARRMGFWKRNGLAPVLGDEGEEFGAARDGVAPYVVKGVSTYYGPDGEQKGQWVKTSLDAEQRSLMMRAAVEAMGEGIPRDRPALFAGSSIDALCVVITLTDSHVGMRALKEEAGADWNLDIAEETLVGCFARLIESLPPASDCIINQIGDWLHFDGMKAVTPTHGHLLDPDGGFERCAKVAVRILRRVVALALARFQRIRIVLGEGNHDPASSCWLRILFANLYELEPRITVDTSELPFYVHQHGKTMLGFHHGHLKKPAELPLLYAAMFPQVWGSTAKRYVHCGHRHHEEVKEHAGMKVVQHSTLAARDAYAARGGWLSERQARAFTYHTEYGEVGSVVVTPEMLAA